MDAPSDPSLEPGGDLAEGGVRVSENERSGGDSRDGGHRRLRMRVLDGETAVVMGGGGVMEAKFRVETRRALT